MIVINSSVGRCVRNDDQELVFFHGTSYLGMTVNENLHELMAEGMRLYGSNYPTSRISNVKHFLYEEFERTIADRMGFEDAITVSSGFLAGQLASTLYKEFETVYYSPDIHPALCQSEHQSTLTFNYWSQNIVSQINSCKQKKIAIVTNSLNSLFGIVYDFSFLLKINNNIDVYVFIDDSHGFGVLGDNGEGIVSLLPHHGNIHYILVCSMSKANGIPGGVVFCDHCFAAKLRTSIIYTSSSAMSLAYLHAFLHADSIYREARKKLWTNIHLFNKLMKNNWNLQNDERFPIYYSSDSQLYEFCLNHKVVVSSFSYPKPNSPRVTRIVLTALHEKADLLNLADILEEFNRWKQLQ